METSHESGPNQDRSGELHLNLDTIVTTETQQVGATRFMPEHPPGKGATAPNQTMFYTQDDPSLDEPGDPFGTMLAAPFQMSEAMPPIHPATSQMPPQRTSPTPPPSNSPRTARSFPFMRAFILVAIIVVIIFTGLMAMLAQSAPTLPAKAASSQTGTTQARSTQTTPIPQPGTGKTPTTPGTANSSPSGTGIWLPQPLPAGWTDAGLTTGDALFAERTANAFTDREMSLDFRSVGTRQQHGGTFTTSLFILTPNAKTRFAQNDVRVINNILFDTVQQEKRIQSVINPQPQVIKFATQGQQQFAWVDVSFQLWISKVDATGKRTEGIESDPTTNQPRTHHMSVLLLRMPQDTQGANPAMGGTGWLVTTYELDQNGPLDIIQPA